MRVGIKISSSTSFVGFVAASDPDVLVVEVVVVVVVEAVTFEGGEEVFALKKKIKISGQ